MHCLRLLRFGALGCVFLAALSAAPLQWTAATGGNDNWYDVVNVSIFSPIGFDQARANALASTHMGMGGYLATITSAEEQQFIVSSFSFAYGFNRVATAFLGADDTAQAGDYRWLDGPEAGQALSYTDWEPGYPRTDSLPLALYLNANSGDIGWVNDNAGTFGYVVEYGNGQRDSQSAVPEPSTWALAGLGIVGLAIRRRMGR